MAQFIFAPTPNKEAADFIKSKPLVSRSVFAKLLPELKARAFVISGIEAADVLQRTREALAELPQGGDWETIKKGIYHDLCPHFVDPKADAEEQEGQRKAAERRAELLLRTHGQQAYAAAQYAMLDEQRDLFPFWQYLSLGDDHVRETHAALDGVVLPADHEFWQSHYPPWEWSCRCQVVPLTRGDTARLAARQKDKPKDQQDVLDEFAQKDLTATRRLVRNGVTYNVTAPREEGKPGAFTFHPADLKIDLATLQARYDAETWAAFSAWAKATRIEEMNKTVWGWLGGSTEWPELGELKVVKKLGGSTGAELVRDGEGRLFVRKRGNSAAHLREEVAADQAYTALGLEVPKVKLYPGDVKLAPFIEGQTLAEALRKATPAEAEVLLARVRKGFVADALLANYDVAGLGLDNLLIDKSGQVWRIDNGGSLRFRAQGAAKDGFGPEVTELKTMRDARINPAAARVFGGITDDEIKKQIAAILPKREALLAALPADLRDVMAKRLEYLASYGKEAVSSTANPFTVEFTEAARKSRIVGKSIDMDGGDIEDASALVWAEVDAAGGPLTRMKLKLTEGGMKKMLAHLKDSLPAGGPSAAVAAFDEPAIYQQILGAAKTVNHHQSDGAYNLAKIQALDSAEKALANAVQKKAIAKADAAHYLDLIAGIKAAVAAKGPAPQVALKGIKLLPQKKAKATAADTGLTINRVPITYPQKAINKGFARNEAALVFNKGTMYEAVIDGVKVRFKPYEEPPGSDLYALQGLVEIEHAAALDKAALDKIHAALGAVGIDNKATTPEYRESLYLWRGINLRRDLATDAQRASAAAILADAQLPDAERLAKLKGFVQDTMKLKLPKPGSADYNPEGEGNAFGQGYRRHWRWDLPRAKVEKDMDGYVLTHNSSKATPELINQWLHQGGDCTPTAERLRKGVPITSGMSPDTDLNYGTSSYFFTRIKKREQAGAPFQFKIGNLARQDILSMGGDWLAGESQVWKPGVRAKSAVKAADWKAHAKRGSNETLFKWGFNFLDEIDTITAQSAAERKQILDVFASHGWTDKLPDGRAIADVVKLK